LTPRSQHNYLKAFNQRFRGMFRILPYGGNLRLINVVHVDDYLKGVVPLEIGFIGEPEMEAIKAQAVAARTYSISHLEQYPKEPYDLNADVSDQVYRGVDVENDLVSRAVDATRGVVMKFHDELINAYYHSTCGGSTDDIDEVWDRKAEPYLRAVPDSGFCDWSKYSEWRESYSVRQIALRLEEYLSAERGKVIRIERVDDMEITGFTAGGRVANMVVTTDRGTFNFGKDKIRWVFTRSSNPELILQSAKFKIRKQTDSKGRLTRIDFVGAGYGHGVGMCQTGAIGMSRAGREYETILKHYYLHVDLVRLY
jgi:stage II sporulation protein D